MPAINMAYFLPCTKNEGPGKRAVVWVQGCCLDCPGCCNPELQPLRPAQIIEVEAIWSQVQEAAKHYQLEGITLLGGEPFLQAKGLAVLAQHCQQAGLSVMVFTGYTLDMLHQKPLPGTEVLLAYTDVLVDGPYLSRQPEETRNWCGSKNQRFHYLSDRYCPAIETDPSYLPTMEVAVSKEILRINGYPF